jgi:hypothetical protein
MHRRPGHGGAQRGDRECEEDQGVSGGPSKPVTAAALTVALAIALSGWTVTPLASFKDHFRVLVVSAPSAANPTLARQDQWLMANGPGLKDRDVVVIRIIGDAVQAPGALKLDAQSLRQALGLRPANFGVALVGKDGDEALRQSAPITMTSLFTAIDAMPMRQRELQERKR